MIITADTIISWKPCNTYPAERIHDLVGTGLKPRQIAELSIPIADRYWVLHRLLRDASRRLLTASIAERALMFSRVADLRSWNAVKAIRLFALREISCRELIDARTAAEAAASETNTETTTCGTPAHAKALARYDVVIAAWHASGINTSPPHPATRALYFATCEAARDDGHVDVKQATAKAMAKLWDDTIEDTLRLIEEEAEAEIGTEATGE